MAGKRWCEARRSVLESLGRKIPDYRDDLVRSEYRNILSKLADMNLKQSEIGEVLGLSQATIVNDMRMLGVRPSRKWALSRVEAARDAVSLAGMPKECRAYYTENLLRERRL